MSTESSGSSAATRALQHYTSMATADREENAQLAWLREENDDDDDDDEQETSTSLFCGRGIGAFCAAIHHLHPYETATSAAARRKAHREPQAKNEPRGIPSSEMSERATGAGEVAAEGQDQDEEEEVDVEIDVHAPTSSRLPQQPMSLSQQQGHDDVYTAAAASREGRASTLPTTTPLSDMLATLRGTRPAAAAAAAAASDTAPESNITPPQPPPTRQPNPNQRRRLHAIPLSLKSQKFVQCMSCREEEWLQVPQTAKYVRCPTCSSITIALASNTRFPAREGGREGGSPCTRLMALLALVRRRGGGPASL